ncbi:aminoglycoside phosphotransferase family protein [Viridibacillus sp. NPDC096237]|uniref:aminoglycoside phosphotransferase family protein n=1 Tax=Viridibacillus sp. NPDC096237 TaxID=3390721 RepID=UPI003CFC044C
MNLGDPIAIGNTAKIYLFENKIVKVFKDYLPDTESLYEANKQKYAYSCGIAVPKVLDVTKIDGKQAIIMEYIKGRTLGNLLSENMKQAEYYINVSIDIQRKIHTVTADSLEPMSVRLRRQIESAHNLDKKHKSDLIEKLNSMTFENRLCHGDYHLFNLIMSDNKVTIIDWVDASAGDILADIYRTYLLYSEFSTEIAEMYLRLYCEKCGFFKYDVFQWAPIIAGARLAENVSSEEAERLMNIINHYYLR